MATTKDHVSDVRSFGSNYHGSQSRKMSIGIAPASSANMSNTTGNRHNRERRKGSPWISPKPLARSKPLGQSFNTAQNMTNVIALDGTYGNLKGVKDSTVGTGLQSGTGKQKKVDNVFPGKENIKDVSNTPERGKELIQEARKEIRVPNDVVKQPKPMENRNKDSLKLKLWEVLRTTPINKGLGSFGSVNVDVNVMAQKNGKKDANVKMQEGGKEDGSVIMQTYGKKEANVKMQEDRKEDGSAMQNGRKKDADVMTEKDGKKQGASLKPRVNSDTIETDSENPEVAVSRPVTRSLTRKRGPNVTHPKRLRKKLFHSSEEKNVFSFDEKSNQTQYAPTGRHLQSKTNSTGKKKLDIRRGKTSGPPPQMSNIQQSSGSKRPSNGEEISLRGGLGIAHGYQDQGSMKQAVTENAQSSPESNDNGELGEGNNDLLSQENGGMKDHINCESAPKIGNLINDIFGPASKMQADAPLPTRTAQEKEIGNQTYTRLLGRRILLAKDANRFKGSQTAKQISSSELVESDDTVQSVREIHDAELFTPAKRKFNKTEGELSISKGSGDHMDAIPGKCIPGEYMDITPRIAQVEKLTPRKSKKVDAPPKFNHSKLNSPFCFPNDVPSVEGSGDDSESLPDVGHAEKHISSHGHHETHEDINYNNPTRSPDLSQEYQEDEMERAVALFRSGLEKFKNKLVSSTKRRSSEVLKSTAEEINSKFESAKSQIEKDVTKLTNSSRSKRKILEKSFDEQQEQLQLIHKKFKDELRRHIEAYTVTVENLEADGDDLKRALKTRKASHMKLIKEVEEAVETCLSDAQRKLTSIQKEGKSKLQQLKSALSDCVEDGIFA